MKIDLPDDRPRLSIALPDGSEAVISPLVEDDRLLLVAGLDELSLESRYRRFGQGRANLSDSELDYLSAIDQRSHVAWVAAIGDEGAGVGRYIVDEAGCAEVAVTVVDRFQRRGVGRLLFDALASVARNDGVQEFCFEVVTDNEAVRQMIQGLEVALDESGSVLLGRVALEEIPKSRLEDDFVELMDLVRDRD